MNFLYFPFLCDLTFKKHDFDFNLSRLRQNIADLQRELSQKATQIKQFQSDMSKMQHQLQLACDREKEAAQSLENIINEHQEEALEWTERSEAEKKEWRYNLEQERKKLKNVRYSCLIQ